MNVVEAPGTTFGGLREDPRPKSSRIHSPERLQLDLPSAPTQPSRPAAADSEKHLCPEAELTGDLFGDKRR